VTTFIRGLTHTTAKARADWNRKGTLPFSGVGRQKRSVQLTQRITGYIVPEMGVIKLLHFRCTQ